MLKALIRELMDYTVQRWGATAWGLPCNSEVFDKFHKSTATSPQQAPCSSLAEKAKCLGRVPQHKVQISFAQDDPTSMHILTEAREEDGHARISTGTKRALTPDLSRRRMVPARPRRHQQRSGTQRVLPHGWTGVPSRAPLRCGATPLCTPQTYRPGEPGHGPHKHSSAQWRALGLQPRPAVITMETKSSLPPTAACLTSCSPWRSGLRPYPFPKRARR